jgi:spore coat polysaccharide biosynthesis predicted glycosyltransferase SpsG
LFRCDGTRETGLGHVSRCLALAEALAEREIASIFCGAFDAPARRLLGEAGVPIEPARGAEEVARLAHERACTGIVADSYVFDAAYLEALATGRARASLLVIDDFAALSEYPEGALVLNFTVGAPQLEYRGRDLVRLLGPEYLLVRRALTALRGLGNRRPRRARRVLVAMGGGDLLGLSAGIAKALGSAAPDVAVRLPPGSYGDLPADVVLLPGGQLAPAFAWADVCVTGGGLTKYEAAYVGAPPLVVSQTDLEAAETRQFADAGLGVDAGYGKRFDPQTLEETVRSYVCDVGLHNRLRRAAAAAFPADPTGAVAGVFAGRLE